MRKREKLWPGHFHFGRWLYASCGICAIWLKICGRCCFVVLCDYWLLESSGSVCLCHFLWKCWSYRNIAYAMSSIGCCPFSSYFGYFLNIWCPETEDILYLYCFRHYLSSFVHISKQTIRYWFQLTVTWLECKRVSYFYSLSLIFKTLTVKMLLTVLLNRKPVIFWLLKLYSGSVGGNNKQNGEKRE